MTVLTEQFVIDALNSTEQFPIDFDDVWESLDYTRRDNAVRALLLKLVEGIDYVVFLIKEENSEGRLTRNRWSRFEQITKNYGN